MDGLRAIARVHKGLLRLTPNQNLIIADVEPEARAAIDVLLTEHGLGDSHRGSALRLNSIACVALPTCGLAMAEAERYLPDLITRIERSEEHTSELQSLMRNSYAVFCLKKKNNLHTHKTQSA